MKFYLAWILILLNPSFYAAFFKELLKQKTEEETAPKKLTITESIMSYLQTMFGGVVGARHPYDRAVIFFDIILPSNNIYTLEISHHEIHHNLWQQKAKKLFEEIADENN